MKTPSSSRSCGPPFADPQQTGSVIPCGTCCQAGLLLRFRVKGKFTKFLAFVLLAKWTLTWLDSRDFTCKHLSQVCKSKPSSRLGTLRHSTALTAVPGFRQIITDPDMVVNHQNSPSRDDLFANYSDRLKITTSGESNKLSLYVLI